MKSNEEILDNFGKSCIENVFDKQYKFIKYDTKDLAMTQGYENLFDGMTEVQKIEIEKYTSEILKGTLFDFLKIFEEKEEFKLIYEEDGKQVNLANISEMLKAEPIIENGWIDRFSKYAND